MVVICGALSRGRGRRHRLGTECGALLLLLRLVHGDSIARFTGASTLLFKTFVFENILHARLRDIAIALDVRVCPCWPERAAAVCVPSLASVVWPTGLQVLLLLLRRLCVTPIVGRIATAPLFTTIPWVLVLVASATLSAHIARTITVAIALRAPFMMLFIAVGRLPRSRLAHGPSVAEPRGPR